MEINLVYKNGIILSICIPTYNRFNLFKASVECAINAIKNHKEIVEIIVSENPSLETEKNLIKSHIEYLISMNPKLSIVHNVNRENIGNNNVKVVTNLARGKYCWVIGDDDFIKPYAIDYLMDRLISNEFDFLSINYDRIYLNDFNTNDFGSLINNLNNLNSHKNNNVEDLNSIGLSDLIHPKFKNVYLGAIMGNIFKTSIWRLNENKINQIKNEKIVNDYYPHVVKFANNFMDAKSSYVSRVLITVGEGAREWANGDFWLSGLPIIYLNVLPSIIQLYKSNGLNNYNYKICLKENSKLLGSLYVSFYWRLISNKKIHNKELIVKKIINKDSLFTIEFYLGILKGFIKLILGRS